MIRVSLSDLETYAASRPDHVFNLLDPDRCLVSEYLRSRGADPFGPCKVDAPFVAFHRHLDTYFVRPLVRGSTLAEAIRKLKMKEQPYDVAERID